MANTLKFGAGNWATKEGSTLAYNDENNNFKPLPFDFSRASSATRVNKEGLIETVGSGEPRVDFKDNTKGALLLEPNRTNLITYSEDFSNVAWAGGNVTRELNQIISPDGTLNATKLSATASFSQIQQSYTSVNNTDYTLSLFVKSPSSSVIGLRLASGTNDVRREFNLSTLSIQSMGGNNQELIDEGIVDFGNGWYRIFLTCKSDGTSSSLNIYPKNSSDATFQSVYAWGAQLEEGSYPTSYIPTSGSAVTRIADACYNGGNEQVINSTEGVLYLHTKPITDDYSNNGVNFSSQINLSDGNLNNGVNIRFRGTALQCLYYNGLGYEAVLTYNNISVSETYKVAFLYKQNDFKMYVNGVLISSDTSGSIGSFTLDRVTFDNSNGVNPFYGKVKDVRVYNTALTDQELIALTTI